MLPLPYWITVLATAISVMICVVIHYEGLRILSATLPAPNRSHRRRIVTLVVALMVLHITEIWVFAAWYFVSQMFDGYGTFAGLDNLGLLDSVYYSAAVFTTLGFGDIVPEGPIRFTTGVEAVCGLTLIAWSASYTLMEMLKSWDDARG